MTSTHGWLFGDHLTVLRALTAVTVLLAVAALISSVIAQPGAPGD